MRILAYDCSYQLTPTRRREEGAEEEARGHVTQTGKSNGYSSKSIGNGYKSNGHGSMSNGQRRAAVFNGQVACPPALVVCLCHAVSGTDIAHRVLRGIRY